MDPERFKQIIEQRMIWVGRDGHQVKNPNKPQDEDTVRLAARPSKEYCMDCERWVEGRVYTKQRKWSKTDDTFYWTKKCLLCGHRDRL